ncbi:DUF2970 domain-containing protein [Thalassomonas sp. M1454]|uniref:DUF2970 domain-containing protein n=1 Tax=Thalassomonas sp. M1454 TaxID=2594477 RepID=UPI001180D005|nr:DUF2970 domain-containing protein [Thalassomonas sp. M1454]TRX57854.1 DUF2970 domain-containing protein [Thalassomonas sp. M1454]
MSSNETKEKDESSPSLKDVVASVAAAFIGVQSNKNRERDFTKGKFSHFVVVGLIGVVLFVAMLIAIVSLVLPS